MIVHYCLPIRLLLVAVGVLFGAGSDRAAAQPPQATAPANQAVHLEIEWSDLPMDQRAVSGTLELTNGSIDRVVILKGNGTVAHGGWNLEPVGHCFRVRVDLRVSADEKRSAKAAILTVRANAEGFSFFPLDVKPGQDIVCRCPAVLVTVAGSAVRYDKAATEIAKAGKKTMLQRLAEQPEWSEESAAQMSRPVTRSSLVVGLDRDWESFWISPMGSQISTEEREPTGEAYARSSHTQHHFAVGPVLGDAQNLRRGIEKNYLPVLRMGYDVGKLHCDITAFAGTLLDPLTLEAAAKEPALAVFYEARVRNDNAAAKDARLCFCLKGLAAKRNATADKEGRLASDEMPGKFQAKAYVDDGTAPIDGVWKISLAPGREAIYRAVLPYWPQSRETIDAAVKADFVKKHDEVCAYWKQRLAGTMDIKLPEQALNDAYRSALIHILLRVFPGRFQAAGGPPYKYTPRALDYGMWNGWFCPIASESVPMITFLDLAGMPPDLVEACLQYYYNRQCDDGRLQVIYYDIETPWVLWASWDHFRLTRNADWARRIAPQVVNACDWIVKQRRISYKEPEGGYGRGLFSGNTADEAPSGGGRNFMFNGYMYAGLHAAGQLLKAIGDPNADRLLEDSKLYKHDIRATLDEAVRRAPLVQLGDGFWWPAIPPQHNIRGLASWIGFASHGANYLHDSELGPLHMVFAGVLDPGERPVDAMLNVMSDLVWKERGIAESQPSYSRHAWVMLERGDASNFLRAFYNLRYHSRDRETGTWWEHGPGGYGSVHKTHEEAWWVHHLRWALVFESGNDLKLCAGIPRRWLADGKDLSITRAATPYGTVGFEIRSTLAADGCVNAAVRLQRLPDMDGAKLEHIVLRLPHPDGKRLQAVRVGGNPWTNFDPAMETITLPADQASLDIVATYR